MRAMHVFNRAARTLARSVPAGLAALALTAFASPALAAYGQPEPWQITFQDPASPVMERIVTLSNTLNILIVVISALVTALVAYVVWRFRAGRNPKPAKWSHNTPLELAWTLIPVLILVAIAFPSFNLLYYMDRTREAEMTLKVIGHQWYWSYEYPDHQVSFDANMVAEEDLQPGQPRLLATDNYVVLPVNTNIRIQMTADDVIHAWAVPSLGVKTDSTPGRLNETWTRIERPGEYYGQCSELCGVNHAFMPIAIRAVSREEFDAWAAEQRQAQNGSEPQEKTVAQAEPAPADDAAATR